MKQYLGIIISALILAVLLISTCSKQTDTSTTKVEIDTVYIEKVVEVRDTVLQTKYVNRIKLDTLVILSDTIIRDTIAITVPIDNYTTEFTKDSVSGVIYHSGYKSNIDSLRLNLLYPIVYNNTTTTVYKSKRWAIGPTAGIGYSITNKSFDAFVGFGVTYNLIK